LKKESILAERHEKRRKLLERYELIKNLKQQIPSVSSHLSLLFRNRNW